MSTHILPRFLWPKIEQTTAIMLYTYVSYRLEEVHVRAPCCGVVGMGIGAILVMYNRVNCTNDYRWILKPRAILGGHNNVSKTGESVISLLCVFPEAARCKWTGCTVGTTCTMS